METGTVTLTNTKEYPFNNSEQTIALQHARKDNDYMVYTEVVASDGDTSDIRIYDKAANGFRIAYEGAAKRADIRYRVVGYSITKGGEADDR